RPGENTRLWPGENNGYARGHGRWPPVPNPIRGGGKRLVPDASGKRYGDGAVPFAGAIARRAAGPAQRPVQPWDSYVGDGHGPSGFSWEPGDGGCCDSQPHTPIAPALQFRVAFRARADNRQSVGEESRASVPQCRRVEGRLTANRQGHGADGAVH